MKLTVFIIFCVLGAVTGYFNAHNYVTKRSPYWIALKESNENTSKFLDELTQTIKETDWCDAGRAALAQGGGN